MSVIFPITASLLFRQTTGPWYNGSNAPGSGSGGELSYDNMDYNWYNLNLASYQIIQTIKGAAYTGSSNTFTQPNTFLSNVGISGSLTGSTARFSGQLISSFPGVGFVGTASWALNVVGGGGGGTQNLQSVTTIGNQTSASVILLGGVTGSSFTGSFTGSFLGSLFGTSSYALSALSSSYSVTSSYSTTASYALNASQFSTTGSFTGSFTGSILSPNIKLTDGSFVRSQNYVTQSGVLNNTNGIIWYAPSLEPSAFIDYYATDSSWGGTFFEAGSFILINDGTNVGVDTTYVNPPGVLPGVTLTFSGSLSGGTMYLYANVVGVNTQCDFVLNVKTLF